MFIEINLATNEQNVESQNFTETLTIISFRKNFGPKLCPNFNFSGIGHSVTLSRSIRFETAAPAWPGIVAVKRGPRMNINKTNTIKFRPSPVSIEIVDLQAYVQRGSVIQNVALQGLAHNQSEADLQHEE